MGPLWEFGQSRRLFAWRLSWLIPLNPESLKRLLWCDLWGCDWTRLLKRKPVRSCIVACLLMAKKRLKLSLKSFFADPGPRSSWKVLPQRPEVTFFNRLAACRVLKCLALAQSRIRAHNSQNKPLHHVVFSFTCRYGSL